MSDSKNLSSDEQSMLYGVLTEYELLFYVTLRTWKTKPLDIELQPRAKTYCSKPYQMPREHGAVFCKEVERFYQLGVLKEVNRSEWRAPTFIQPKKLNGNIFVQF